jgi:CheY-like chemotaxis protein
MEVEKLAALGRLSAAVAHEINNPAAAVAANLGYMRDVLKNDEELPADAVEVIDDTLESIDRISRIVQQLGGAGELAIRGGDPSIVRLSETARRAMADAHADLPEGVALSLEVPEELCAHTQEGSLRQVVTGLIVSAAQAMRAAKCTGRIHVDAHREGRQIILRVTDPCPQPDAEQLARRFDPFLSARPTQVAKGVGLSVSVALLRVFGCTMTLERGGEDGSTVRVDLPAAEAPPQRSDSPSSSRAPRARVLLVDDDVLVRIGLRRLLGREYVLEEAGTVDEALACVRASADGIDAIVCDLVMPDGGAARLLEELERMDTALASATVLMTGGAVDEPTQQLLDANADRVLRKPVDVGSVRALIDRVRLRRRAGVTAAPKSG